MSIVRCRKLIKELDRVCKQAEDQGESQVHRFISEDVGSLAVEFLEDIRVSGRDSFLNQACVALTNPNVLERSKRKRAATSQSRAVSDPVNPAPARSKARRTEVGAKSHENTAIHQCLKLIPDRIRVRNDIKERLTLWESDFLTFFDNDQHIQMHSDVQPGGLYSMLRTMELRSVIDQVRRRILLAVLWKFVERLESSRATDRIIEDIATMVQDSGLVAEDMQSVQGTLTDWVKAGRRYNSFGSALGSEGSIVLLPLEIGQSYWENQIPLTGPRKDLTVERLKRAGIVDEAEKRWDVALRPGDQTTGTASVNSVVRRIFDNSFVTSVWIHKSTTLNAPTKNPYRYETRDSQSSHGEGGDSGAAASMDGTNADQTALVQIRRPLVAQQTQQPASLRNMMNPDPPGHSVGNGGSRPASDVNVLALHDPQAILAQGDDSYLPQEHRFNENVTCTGAMDNEGETNVHEQAVSDWSPGIDLQTSEAFYYPQCGQATGGEAVIPCYPNIPSTNINAPYFQHDGVMGAAYLDDPRRELDVL